MNKRQKLIQWLNILSISKGEEFLLSSGQISNVYVDLKKTAMNHRTNKLLAELLYDRLEVNFMPVEAIAGVALGGCHLASSVAMLCPLGHDVNVVYVRQEIKNHGTKKIIERPAMTENQSVVLIEDVITTGQSALRAVKLLQDEGYSVKGILAVVNRRDNKSGWINNIRLDYLVDFEELDF